AWRPCIESRARNRKLIMNCRSIKNFRLLEIPQPPFPDNRTTFAERIDSTTEYRKQWICPARWDPAPPNGFGGWNLLAPLFLNETRTWHVGLWLRKRSARANLSLISRQNGTLNALDELIGTRSDFD